MEEKKAHLIAGVIGILIVGIIIGVWVSDSMSLKETSSDKNITQDSLEKDGALSNSISEGARKAGERYAAQYDSVYTILESDLTRGDETSDIVIIEYSDIQCPFCKRIHEPLLNISQDGVLWVYRHLPLDFHPQAEDASVIVECVSDIQGKERAITYLDFLFENQGNISSNQYLIDTATQTAGISRNDISKCLAQGSTQRVRVESHSTQAQFLSISGTPGGIIFNKSTGEQRVIGGALPENQIRELVNQVR